MTNRPAISPALLHEQIRSTVQVYDGIVGALQAQIAILQASNEEKDAEIAALKAKAPSTSNGVTQKPAIA